MLYLLAWQMVGPQLPASIACQTSLHSCMCTIIWFATPLPGAGNSPSVLILSPTRELALQTAGVMEEAGSRCGLKTLCVYGGVPKPPQVCDASFVALRLMTTALQPLI